MNKETKPFWSMMWKILLIAVAVLVFIQLLGSKLTLLGILRSIGVTLLAVLSPMLIIFSVLGSMRLFRKLYPLKEEDRIEVNPTEVNTYSRYYLIATGLFFLGWPIGGFLSYWFFEWLAEKWFALLPGVYIAPIEKAYWMGPSIFIGVLFGMLFSTIFMKLLVREQHKRFIGFFDNSWGYSNKRAGKIIVFGYLLLIIALIYIGFSSYARFTEDGVYIHRCYQFSEEYHPYKEVTKIEQRIRKSKYSHDNVFAIEFSDGKQWRTTSIKDEDIPENFPAIMGFVSEKSERKYNQVTVND